MSGYNRPLYFHGMAPLTQGQQQHTQLPPWHQQNQPMYYQAQAPTQPPQLVQSLLYGSPGVMKSESLSPQAPLSTSKSPVPPVPQKQVETKQSTSTPVPPVTGQQQVQKEDVFYLAIPNSERLRPEVKSLLGETSPIKQTDEPFIPPPASGIKEEPNTVEETTVSPLRNSR